MTTGLRLVPALCLLATLQGAPSADPAAPVELNPLTVTARTPLKKEARYELKEARYGAAAVSLGDYIYIIGGSNDAGTPLDSIERFDPRTGKSEQFARLKVARRHHRAVVVAGKIYVLGGSSYVPARPEDADGDPIFDGPGGDGGFVEAMTRAGEGESYAGAFMRPPSRSALNPLEHTMEVIDPATGRVSLAPSMPVAKARFSCAAIQGKIYVIGGLRSRGGQYSTTNTTEVFDSGTGRWSAGINMPTPRQSYAAAVGDFIVVAGGLRQHSGLTEVESFFPAGKVWRRLPPLLEKVDPSSVVFLGHELYLFGSEGATDRIMTYDLMQKVSGVHPLPYERVQYAATVVHEGKIYLLGGTDLYGLKALRSVQVFSPPPETGKRG